jgi:hypothetical protein
MVMGTPYSPSRKDVERYLQLRALSMDLNRKIIKTVPRRAYHEVGDAIGMLRNGVLEFESTDMASVLIDSCLYDWFENGKNVVQRYSETHAPKPETDERYLLDAYLQARYRVLVARSTTPGAGLQCTDVLNGGELFLMDIGLSHTVRGANAAFAIRTIPLDQHWITTGAGLPISSKEAALEALRRIDGGTQPPSGPGSVALTIVRACLATGAADHVRYARAVKQSKQPRHQPRRRHSRSAPASAC